MLMEIPTSLLLITEAKSPGENFGGFFFFHPRHIPNVEFVSKPAGSIFKTFNHSSHFPSYHSVLNHPYLLPEINAMPPTLFLCVSPCPLQSNFNSEAKVIL